LITGIIAGVFTTIGSVLTHLFTMRKFHKELLENTMKNFMMIEKGYIILWKKLRFLAKHYNKPEFTYQNLKNF
jgi:hypothetical protein